MFMKKTKVIPDKSLLYYNYYYYLFPMAGAIKKNRNKQNVNKETQLQQYGNVHEKTECYRLINLWLIIIIVLYLFVYFQWLMPCTVMGTRIM